MKKIDRNSVVALFLRANWESSGAKHTDCYQANPVNVWRDTLPPALLDALVGCEAGDDLHIRMAADDAVSSFSMRKLIQIKRNQLRTRLVDNRPLSPKIGRFYPKGLLKDVTGIFSENMEPFRLVLSNNGHLTADLNHPIAGKNITVKAAVGNIEEKHVERGGTSLDWLHLLLEGPGMQARWMDTPTDFWTGRPFERQDEEADSIFYSQPRWVQHLDDTAIQMVGNTYARFLKNDMKVLDLMSSWQSHVPSGLLLKRLTGLGLNEAELRKNRQLTDFVVQDLNIDTALPFESNYFDAVLCTVSIEYLIDPSAVFMEVSRILRPDGYFILTFSNRWFSSKVIRIWKEIHEFERMGLVLEYFMRSGKFKDLQTYSIRGLPRPKNDKYYPELRFSDPVFAVWGRKK